MHLRITNSFERLSDGDLLGRVNTIMSGMTGNAYFPTPTPTLAQVQNAIDAFSDALAIAQSGSNLDKHIKNQKRFELIEIIHSLSNYVLFIANGDVLAAQSSNFSIARPPSPGPVVTAPTNQQLKDGPNRGELIFSFDKVQGAKSYIYQYAADPVNDTTRWEMRAGTTREISFAGLDSGKRYWCRVLTIGTKGHGVLSEPVSRIAQ